MGRLKIYSVTGLIADLSKHPEHSATRVIEVARKIIGKSFEEIGYVINYQIERCKMRAENKVVLYAPVRHREV